MNKNYWYYTINPMVNGGREDILWGKIKSLSFNNYDFKVKYNINQKIYSIASGNIEGETKQITNKEFYELFVK